ncbi:uncharacterized protein mgarpa [Clarias gariepinus]
MMYPCRAALQRFSSLSRHSMTHRVILHRDVVPRRLMSSVPGGTGENVMLVLLCGGAFAAAVTYAYRTVCRDSARFTERMTEIAARPKNEGKTKPWPPKNAEKLAAVAAPSEAKVEEAAPATVELPAEVNRVEPASVVETVAEVVAEAAEAVAEVAGVVEETAKEVAAVAHEVEKVAEEVEAAAKELETPALPVVEETADERNGTEAASQEEAKPEA